MQYLAQVNHYSLFRNNWHPIFLRKQFVFLGKRSLFLHKSPSNALRIFIINFIFELAQGLNLFLKARFLENLRKKTLEFGQHQQVKPG